MKSLYRGFLIAMLLLIALGIAMVVRGAWQNAHRPVAPLASEDTVRGAPAQRWEMKHV